MLWDNFKSVDEHLKTNKYHYQLIKNGNSINFVEKVNCDIINEIEFELEGDISWEILKAANSEILSFDLLRDKFSFFKEEDLISKIDELYEIGLIYYNHDKSEIVTIINTNNLIV